MLSDFSQPINRVSVIQKIIQEIHPFLQRLFPIAVAEEGQFLVYQPGLAGFYRLEETMPTPMPVPQGVRAAFPLDSVGNRMACVVTGDVFDESDGYVTIFYEFIHCQQYEIFETSLKQSHSINSINHSIIKESRCNQDMSW